MSTEPDGPCCVSTGYTTGHIRRHRCRHIAGHHCSNLTLGYEYVCTYVHTYIPIVVHVHPHVCLLLFSCTYATIYMLYIHTYVHIVHVYSTRHCNSICKVRVYSPLVYVVITHVCWNIVHDSLSCFRTILNMYILHLQCGSW